jgi:hypothetical protein
MSSNLANDLVQWRSKAKDDLDAFYRLIASNTPYVDNDALDEFTSVLSCFRGSLTGFKLLVKEISPTLTLGTSEQLECFDLAFGFNYSYNSPDLIRMALGNSSISGAVVQECNSTGQTYLFAAARAVAGCSAPGFKLFIEPSVDELCALLHVSDEIDSKSFIKSFDWNSYPRCGWMALVRQLIVAGADIHAITDASETPFISALMASYDRSRSPWTCTAMAAAKRAPQMLRSWVEALHHARVDLELYGEKETELQLSGAVSKDVFGHRYSGPGHQSWRIIGFSYGARPNDWKLWVSESTDEFAGQFWDMIDHPERKIPGAWNDELDAYD